MVLSPPSIAEEDEYRDNDPYDYDRLQNTADRRTEQSLVKNQNESLPQITSTAAA
jgi:hypothetical protein